jgi:hypothetical protein
MEPIKKIRVSIVLKSVSDQQDKAITNADGDAITALSTIKKTLDALATKNDEEEKGTILHLLSASKLSQEVMASAFAEVNREDLFEEKFNTISSIDAIINQINNL